MNSYRAVFYYLGLALLYLPKNLSLYVYVKWILWRDNMIDKLRRKTR